MIDYYRMAIHEPLKNHFIRQAEIAEARAELRAEREHGRLQQMIGIIRKSVDGAVETLQEFRASHA